MTGPAHPPPFSTTTGPGTGPRPARAWAPEQRFDLPWVIPSLVRGLGLPAGDRAMAEALPHAVDPHDVQAVLGALRRLGAEARPWTGSIRSLPQAVLPALLVSRDGSLAVILSRTEDSLLVETDPGARPERVRIGSARGTVHVFAGRDEAKVARGRPLLNAILAENGAAIVGVVALSLLAAIASIALGLVVMVLFDQVIPSGDASHLLMLAAGFAIALTADVAGRVLIADSLARIGSRAERRVLTAVFDKVIRLPWVNVAAQEATTQIARMREVEAARELFTGPLPQAMLHVPVVLLFLVAILAVGGALVLVPLVVLPLQALGAALLAPGARAREAASGSLSAERRRMMLETIHYAETLRLLHIDGPWTERFRDLSAGAAAAQAAATRASQAMQGLAQIGLPIAGASMAALGAWLVVHNSITPGALVTTIMLSWRVLVPMQSLVLIASRGRQVTEAVRQLHRLQQLREEPRPPPGAAMVVPRDHSLRFDRVVFRPSTGAEPALAGVSLHVPEGARAAVTGPSGSGKSSLLRLALGLAQPQGGHVTLGGVNIAQFDPDQLRARIGYVPQRPGLIYGTIGQNLRLAEPAASDEELADACERIGILADIRSLPHGFETMLDDLTKHRLPQTLRQGIAIAQALLRRPVLLLLDDPVRLLDEAREAKLQALLDELHGSTTVLMVTHRPSQMRRADLLVVLDRGTLVSAGPPGAPRPGAAQRRTQGQEASTR